MEDHDDDRNTLKKCEKCDRLDLPVKPPSLTFEDLRRDVLSKMTPEQRKEKLKEKLLRYWLAGSSRSKLRNYVWTIIENH